MARFRAMDWYRSAAWGLDNPALDLYRMKPPAANLDQVTAMAQVFCTDSSNVLIGPIPEPGVLLTVIYILIPVGLGQ